MLVLKASSNVRNTAYGATSGVEVHRHRGRKGEGVASAVCRVLLEIGKRSLLGSTVELVDLISYRSELQYVV